VREQYVATPHKRHRRGSQSPGRATLHHSVASSPKSNQLINTNEPDGSSPKERVGGWERKFQLNESEVATSDRDPVASIRQLEYQKIVSLYLVCRSACDRDPNQKGCQHVLVATLQICRCARNVLTSDVPQIILVRNQQSPTET
jgi:hypothetical protein